jgi:hypothetical protein
VPRGAAAEDQGFVNFLSHLDYDDEASLDTSSSSLHITAAPAAPTRLSARTEDDLQLDKLGFGPAGYKVRDRREIEVALAWEEEALSMSTSSSSSTPAKHKKPWMEDYGATHTWNLKVGDRSTAGMDLALGDRGINHLQHRPKPHADVAPYTARYNTALDQFDYREAPTAYGRVTRAFGRGSEPDPDVSGDSEMHDEAWQIGDGSASTEDTSADSTNLAFLDI